MTRLLLLAAMTAALGSATPAKAFTPVTCVATLLRVVCVPNDTSPGARFITVPEYTDPELTDADRASWAERCKPRKVWDGAITRWVYAAPGCDAGPRHE